MPLKSIITLSGAIALATSLYGQTALLVVPPSDAAIESVPEVPEFSFVVIGPTNLLFEDSTGGTTFEPGYHYTDSLAGLVRQSISYAQPSTTANAWTGWTRVALHQRFSDGVLQPFVGVNAGRLFADTVRDSWTAGLESGAKFYMRPQTYLRATVEYGWLWDKSEELDDRFKEGLWTWSVSVGFSF